MPSLFLQFFVWNGKIFCNENFFSDWNWNEFSQIESREIEQRKRTTLIWRVSLAHNSIKTQLDFNFFSFNFAAIILWELKFYNENFFLNDTQILHEISTTSTYYYLQFVPLASPQRLPKVALERSYTKLLQLNFTRCFSREQFWVR